MRLVRCLILSSLLLTVSACLQNTDSGGGGRGGFTAFWQKNSLRTEIAFNPYIKDREPTLVVIRRMASAESRDLGGSAMGSKGGVERSTWTISENNTDWFTYDVVKEPVTESLTILGHEYSLADGRVFLIDSTKSPPSVTQLDLPITTLRRLQGPNDYVGERDFTATIEDLSAKNLELKRFVSDTR